MPANPYDTIVRRIGDSQDEAQRRREEATRRQVDLGAAPQRVAEAQRLSRQTQEPVAPPDAPRAMRQDQMRRIADTASRYASFARVYADPRLAATMTADEEYQRRIARALDYLPRVAATVAGVPTRPARYRFDDMTAAQIAATLNREEDARVERQATGGRADRRSTLLGRILYTDLRTQLARTTGLDLRDEVITANIREDAARSDGALDDVGDYLGRAFAGVQSNFDSFVSAYLASEAEGPAWRDVVGRVVIGDPARRSREAGLRAQTANTASTTGQERDAASPDSVSGFFSSEGAKYVGQQSLLSAPSLVASFFGRYGLAFNTVTNAGSIAQTRAANEGRSISEVTPQDVNAALPYAVASASLDRFSAGRIVRPVSGRTVGSRLLAAGGRILEAGAVEASTEALQSVIEYSGGVNGTPEPWRVEDAQRAARDGAIVGFVMGSGTRAGGEVINAGTSRVTMPEYQTARRAASEITHLADSEAMAETVGTIMDSAAQHASRASDPEVFREALQAQVEGTPIENLYIPVEALDAYLQSEGAVDPIGLFNSLRDQIDEARLTGGDVVIPIADFAMAAAGTPAWEALKQDIRPAASALSPRETAARIDEIMADLEARGAEIASVGEPQQTLSQGGVPLLNVGRKIDATGEVLTREQVIAQIEAVGGQVVADEDVQSDSEPTSIVTLAAPLTDEQITQLSAALQQKAIARFDERGGAIVGPGAAQWIAEWGDFNPEYFFMPGGARLSDQQTQTLEQAPAAKDPTVSVYEQVKAQLLAIKYKADDARKVAALVATHRARMADMLGMTAEEYHAANPIDFARETAPAADGSTVLGQPPLTGLPTVVKVDGIPREFGPYAPARDAAARVADRLGRVHNPPTDYVRVDVDRATRIAQAYADMKHDPQNPEVKAAYEALISETMAQWAEIKATGLQVEFNQPGVDPYGNPRNAILDVVENNHLWVFPTDDGFGSSDFDPVDNPLLAIVEGETWSGKPVRVNDVFRVVHDYFGHIMEGVGFRADGEENAWRIHSAMYSPLARKALTSETRGQNSWVNFGPHGEANRTASGGDTVYADQKIGLLPDWVVNEGAVEPAIEGKSVVDKVVYHGTAGWFSQFRDTGQPIWFAEDPKLANQYADPRRVRAASGGRVYAMRLDIRNPIDLTGAPNSTEDPKGWVASLGLPPSAFTLDNGSILTYRVFTRPEFVAALKDAGYDGIRIDEAGGTTWGAFSPDQLRHADPANPNGAPYNSNTYYQTSEDIFYSALERAVERGQKKATADQWLATLRNTPGVKAEELAWTGVEEWLADKEGAVPQDELLAFVQGRGVQVEEVVLGESQLRVQQVEDDSYWVVDADNDLVRIFGDEDDARDYIDRSVFGPDAQFKDWSSDPSNDTYRELLITLPLGERGNPERAASTHWDQPGVVAHVRFMDKVDVEGKRVLFVEEVQSDWHQKGRDEGYDTPVSAERIAELLAAADEALAARRVAHKAYADFVKTDEANVDKENALYEERTKAQLAYREAQQAYLNAARPQGIPDAPFKKSWPALAMKRVIRWAAENGYERVAWTTGAQQAERYNLSAATGPLVTQGRDGEDRLKVALEFSAGQQLQNNGLAALTGPTVGTRTTVAMNDAQLREAFGNEIAEKLIAAPELGVIDGSDLNVGGEGMKAFYDRSLVNITNDIIKKFGAKVGPVTIALDRSTTRAFEAGRGRNTIAVARAVYNGQANVQAGFDVTPKMREAALGGFPLFQTRPQGARGQVEFTRDGRAIITLFDRADASTVIHELGHVFFEEMRRNVQLPNAPASLKRDWGVLKQWLGANGAPVVDDVITRDGHELIARGFERYALEGNAPHAALAKVFTAFRKWLQSIYATVDALRAPINDDVRGVFDRWFATEEAIAAHVEEQAKPLLEEKPAQMTAAEFEAYRASVLAARNDAVNRLLEKTMRSIRAQRLDEFRSQRNEIRGVVAEEVNNEPRFRALDALRGAEKLNRNWLVTRFGEDAVNRLPKGPILVSATGSDPELIAEAAGFASADEMVEALFALAQETELLRASGDKRSVRDKLIADKVTEELESIGASDPLRDDAIEAEALGAIHGEQQGEVYSAELRALGRMTGKVVTPYKAAREWAKTKIRQGRVHEVASKSAIQRYARAAAKEGRLAEEAYAKGEHQIAYRHKQAQLINHALVAESRLAATEVERIVKRLSRLSRRAQQKSVSADYFDRVQQLLALYEFKPVSQKMLDEAEGFVEWAAKQAEAGYEVIAPARLVIGRDHYSRITVGALSDLNDAVASLMSLGRLKQRLLDGQEQRAFDATVNDIVGRIATIPQSKLPRERNPDARRGASLIAPLIKIETIAEELDGGTQGPMTRLLVDRAVDAENRRARLRDMVLLPIAQAYNAMPRAQKRRLAEKVTLSKLPHRGGELDPRNGQPTVMTRMEVIAIALNTGNASNLDKLARGEGWKVADILNTVNSVLTREDWAFVETVWRSLDLLWPDIAATEREMSGVVPERVEPRDVATPFGVIRGGYYPVVYDPARSQLAENNADAAADDLFGMKAGIGTPKGHTIARTNAAAPIMLSVEGVLFNHVEKVITRASLAVYARDVMRVTTNKRVRDAIDVRLGSEYRKQIKPWLQRVINSGALDTRGLKWWENVLRQSRVNLTMVAMGFRWSTGVAQVSGLLSSVGRIGAVGMARGIRSTLRNPAAAQRFVFDRSEEMARRSEEMNREVADLHRQLRGKSTVLNRARAMAFWHIAMIDRYVVAIPTWLGAFENAIQQGMTEQQASREGDKAVRLSQGSGREISLANWQSPNSEPWRWLTLFYTYFNVYLNSQWKAVRDAKRGRWMQAAVSTFWFGMAAPLADALLSGDLPDDKEDDEESWFEWAIENIFYHQFSGIPIARDLANFAERSGNDEYATVASTPISRIEEVTVRAAKTIDKAAQGEEPDNWVKTAIETPGYFIGLPTGQPAATAQFLWDVNTGEAEPEDFGDWYLGLTKGRLPEEG